MRRAFRVPTPIAVNEEKWGATLMQAGWTALPNVIIEHQAALGLDALDLNVILHLAHYWWTADNLPHPSVGRIARALGVSRRTIQKRIAALEAGGFIEREERRRTSRGSLTNRYSFGGLILQALPLAQEKLAAIAAKRTGKASRGGALSAGPVPAPAPQAPQPVHAPTPPDGNAAARPPEAPAPKEEDLRLPPSRFGRDLMFNRISR